MFMNIAGTNKLGKSTTHIRKQENKKDFGESYIYMNE